MSLTDELTELIGKIMAQLLSVLALSTKAMADCRISELIGLIRSLCILLADSSSEKILKKLVGRKDIEDALLRLNIYTMEEGLMVTVRNLELAQDLDNGTQHFCLSSCTYQPFSKHSHTRP